MPEPTRERIVTAAIDLFNASSAGEVSTNHIADALGISPGNLYYHFRNKEELIRAVYTRMGAEWDVVFALPDDRASTLDDLDAMVESHFRVLWKYRFFYRELGALMRHDPTLYSAYIARRRRGLADLATLIEAFAAAGVLRLPSGESAVADLADMLWIIADFWLPYIELDGQTLSPETLRDGVRLFQLALRPYRSDHTEL
jgi:AcrR family transcriptional regulator